MTMYSFTITIAAEAGTPEEAWEEAVAYLAQKPGPMPEEYCEIEDDEECKTCKGTGRIVPDTPCWYNCELGGDCSDITGWTEERCKVCGTVMCPECKWCEGCKYNHTMDCIGKHPTKCDGGKGKVDEDRGLPLTDWT